MVRRIRLAAKEENTTQTVSQGAPSLEQRTDPFVAEFQLEVAARPAGAQRGAYGNDGMIQFSGWNRMHKLKVSGTFLLESCGHHTQFTFNIRVK